MYENRGEATCVSLCSGVGGLDLGLHRAGFRHLLLCESEPWRRDVLRARFPGVPIADDIRDVGAGTEPGWHRLSEPRGNSGAAEQRREPHVDLLAGGTPCQDLSVAGRRAGLDGERSGLFFEFARIVESVRPRWVLWENVPGALSSNGGRDFGVILGTLADIGYGLGWRVLDSRYFGVPQRRRRVFLVGALIVGDPRAAAERAGAVLAVGARCGRHPATRGEAGPDTTVASLSDLGSGGPDDNDGQGGRLIAETLRANGKDGGRYDMQPLTVVAETVRSHPRPGSNSNGNLAVVAAPLTSGGHPNNPRRRKEDDENLVTAFHQTQDPIHGSISPALGVTTIGMGVKSGASVRRLTPTECERLQGFPDGWTQLGGTPDSRRYSGLGDAVTVDVSFWIGRRIMLART